MIRSYISAVLLLLAQPQLKAQIFQSNLQKGIHALDRNNLSKAYDYLQLARREDSTSVGVSYGYASLYSNRDFDLYDPEKAYRYCSDALSRFPEADKKEAVILEKLSLTSDVINALASKIDDELFSLAVITNTVETYENFIAQYPSSSNVSKAMQFRDFLLASQSEEQPPPSPVKKISLLPRQNPEETEAAILLQFEKAKASGTIAQLNEFLTEHPGAPQADEAHALIITLEFTETKRLNTVAAYEVFIKQHPDAPETDEAIMLRNQLAYIELLHQQKIIDNDLIANKQNRIEQQQFKSEMLVSGLGALLLVSVFLYYGYREKKKAHHKITNQKEVIEMKNKEIVESINYARRIQSAMLPLPANIQNNFPESFVYFRPRDIVSGDFYWFAEKNNRTYIAAADCTGHGVPGAFVSMMGYNFLNELVNDLDISDPGLILDELHQKIYHALNRKEHSDSQEIHDGMDIALLCIDREDHSVLFSGALRPLFYANENGFSEIKGFAHPIGGTKMEKEKPFPTHRIQLEEQTTFYMFSDGFADQFGGPDGKKFKMKRFRELLQSIWKKSMTEQHRAMENTFVNWMGNHDQVDDVCVIGVRL